MLDGDRRPLARGQRTDHAPADPRSEPLVCHGGRLALVLELNRLAAIAGRFLIAGAGSAGCVPARHRGAQEPGSETGRWRARAGFPVRQG